MCHVAPGGRGGCNYRMKSPLHGAGACFSIRLRALSFRQSQGQSQRKKQRRKGKVEEGRLNQEAEESGFRVCI